MLTKSLMSVAVRFSLLMESWALFESDGMLDAMSTNPGRSGEWFTLQWRSCDVLKSVNWYHMGVLPQWISFRPEKARDAVDATRE